MELEPVEDWLRTMGCSPTRVENAAFRWTVRFDFPASSPHLMEAFSLPSRPGSVLLISSRSVDPRLISAYERASDQNRDAFNAELTGLLLREYIEYRVDQASPTAAPTRFQVLAERFDDGLTQDEFFWTVDHVYKTELAVLVCFHKHFGRAANQVTAAPPPAVNQ
ncbi:MAG TPA: DUF2299 family protein [Steroidobacteraceae bacterium]